MAEKKKPHRKNPDAGLLRKQAEKIARKKPENLETLSPAEASKLIYELSVHQIELQMQNDELRAAEQRLEEAREQYFSLYEMAPVGYFSISEKGTILEANLTGANMLGVLPIDLRSRQFSSLIFQAELDIYYYHRKQLFTTQKPQVFEARIVRKDGSLIWARVETTLTLDGKSGKPVCRMALSDVTAKKQTDALLRGTEEQYRLLSEHVTDTVWLMDMDLNVTYHSPSVQKLRGFTAEEITEMPMDRHFTPESFKLVSKVLSKELPRVQTDPDYNPVITLELEYCCKDGSTVWTEGKFSVIRDEQGRPISIVGEARDITERKRVEDALRKSEERFRYVLENVQDAVWSADLSGQFEYLSPLMAHIYGRPLEEMMDNPAFWIEAAYPEDQLAAIASGEALNRDGHIELEYRIVLPDGTIRWILDRKTLIRDAHGESSRIAGIITDVTGRKNTEETLKESEAIHRLLSEHMTDFIWLMDMDLKPIYQSPSAEKLTGFTHQELMELPFDKRIAPGSLKAAAEIFLEELPRVEADADYNPLISLELEYYCKDGTTAWSENKFSIIRDPGGKAVSILGEARDITDRKQAEENLKRSEERFAAAFNINPDPTAMTVPETGKYVEVNPAFEKWSGFSREELIGRTSRELSFWISPADRDAFLDRLSTHGVVEDMEITFRVRSGELRDTWFTARNVFIAGERYLLTRAHDVTERKRAQEALRESEARFRSLFNSGRDAIAVHMMGKDGRPTNFILVNNATCEKLGYTREEMLKLSPQDIDAPDRAGQMPAIIEQLLKNKNVLFETEHIAKDGRRIPVEISTVLFQLDNSQATMSVARDITERKRLEEEQQRVDKLESVGLLAGGIAHDFNNILTSIMGNISLASMEAQDGSDLQNSLQQAEKASQRAKDLTKQLLTFSKGGAPVTKLASLAELLKDTSGFALRGSNVKCHLSIPDDLWHAEIDAGQVSQVIQNLVINAQQAMQSGGTIEVTAENMALDIIQSIGSGLPLKKGNYVRIAVSDHGGGIDAEHMDKIFDPFFTTKQTGSGLGLATAFSIARNHGGHLSVESKAGAGATFYLYLPASTQTAIPKQANIEAIKPVGRVRILVMDDEVGVREVAGRMLRHIGCQDIEFAAHGAETVKMYKAAIKSGNPFSVVILDLTIAGGMGGKETVKKLLEIDPGVKAIVSSGYVDDSVIARYMEYGFSGVVAKPYTIAELRKAVQDVIG